MTYNANPATVDHIAQLVVNARPEWDYLVIRVVLNSHAAKVDGTDLAIAALRAARNPNFLTPKAIGFRGAHWDDLDTKPPEVTTVVCEVCGKTEARCYERKGVDDDHLFAPSRRLAISR